MIKMRLTLQQTNIEKPLFKLLTIEKVGQMLRKVGKEEVVRGVATAGVGAWTSTPSRRPLL